MEKKTNAFKKSRLIALVLVVVLGAGASFVLFGGDDAKLTEAAAAAASGAAEESAGSSADGGTKTGLASYDKNGDGVVYQDGMHPWYVQDEPGTAPDCGMDLTPVRVDGVEEGTVKIDPVTLQNIGVRTARVSVEALGRSVRTTGRFEASEQGLAAVSPKIGGWVERLHVEYEGARVRRGQPLLEIYSPELVSTQEEYLLALRNAERLGGSADAQRLVEAARRRLAYWDISDAQIKKLEETGTPTKTLTLYAPASGTVTGKNVVEGQQIMPGETLMQLSDLSRLWLMVDVYEQDLSWVGVGTEVRVELPYEPGRTMAGRVDYLYDDLNPQTRTARARVTLANPGLQLKPSMYATAYLVGGRTEPVPTIPEEALIRTGKNDAVIVALGEGRFRPQPVTAGVQADGKVQILSGLHGGEDVVTSAQFLIDSEARLQSALGSMMGGMEMASASGTNGAHQADVVEERTASTQPAQEATHRSGTAPAEASGSAAGKQSAQVVRIAVGPNGFEPARVELKPGVPVRLVFTRTTEATCAKKVQVPEFGIGATDLPLNEPVAVELTPKGNGAFTFACGMNMLKGSLVVTS